MFVEGDCRDSIIHYLTTTHTHLITVPLFLTAFDYLFNYLAVVSEYLLVCVLLLY